MIRWCLHATPCGVLRLGAFGGRLCLCDWADVPARDFVVRRLERGLHVRFAEWPNERLRPGTGLPGIPAEPESNFPDNPDDADRCVLDRAARQLDEYFAAQRRVFDVPLLTVGTPFQRAVWELLTEIPFGETCSYAWLAAQLGHPRAVRAVAAANRANALSIFIPCHRASAATARSRAMPAVWRPNGCCSGWSNSRFFADGAFAAGESASFYIRQPFPALAVYHPLFSWSLR